MANGITACQTVIRVASFFFFFCHPPLRIRASPKRAVPSPLPHPTSPHRLSVRVLPAARPRILPPPPSLPPPPYITYTAGKYIPQRPLSRVPPRHRPRLPSISLSLAHNIHPPPPPPPLPPPPCFPLPNPPAPHTASTRNGRLARPRPRARRPAGSRPSLPNSR